MYDTKEKAGAGSYMDHPRIVVSIIDPLSAASIHHQLRQFRMVSKNVVSDKNDLNNCTLNSASDQSIIAGG